MKLFARVVGVAVLVYMVFDLGIRFLLLLYDSAQFKALFGFYPQGAEKLDVDQRLKALRLAMNMAQNALDSCDVLNGDDTKLLAAAAEIARSQLAEATTLAHRFGFKVFS